MTSVDRIKEYFNLKSEDDRQDDPLVSDNWPENGDIQLIKVSMKYDQFLPYALSDITLKIKSGQKV